MHNTSGQWGYGKRGGKPKHGRDNTEAKLSVTREINCLKLMLPWQYKHHFSGHGGHMRALLGSQ